MARISKLNRIFNSIELNYANLTNQLNNWISATYKKSSIIYNSASPYGQILTMIKEIFVQNILYIKNAVRQFDIDQAVTIRTIRNIARISGHNPSRAISAQGTLKFKLKQGIDITQVAGGKIIIYNETQLKNISNSLYYSIKTGTYRNYYTLKSGCQFFINIIQGKYETQTFTGDGTLSQSFQVAISNNSTIDNFDFQISLNGVILQIRDHLYDMLQDEYSCYTRTGFNGGLDIYFGNGINGCIPSIGSVIEVKYLTTNGLNGNILNNNVNDFTFIDDIYDSDGNVIQADKLFDIYIETDINFASDGESIEYTRSIISHVSRNFVLATPDQFIYHLMKLNIFSKVNAYNTLDTIKIDLNSNTVDDININQMYLYLIPRITDYFSSNINYFNIPFDYFYLDQEQKNRIINYLKMEGILSISSIINIIDPIIKKYIMNIFIIRYNDTSEDNIREQVLDTISTYFSSYSRYDRIVKANLITELKDIDGIDSLNLEFISKDNEDYIRTGSILSSTQSSVLQSTYTSNSNSVNVSKNSYQNTITATNNTNSINSNGSSVPTTPNYSNSIVGSSNSSTSIGSSTVVSYTNTSQYDSSKQIGLDPILGDIIIGNNELVVLRGGWINRNGIYFNEDPTLTSGFSTVNIIWKGVTYRT